MGNQISNFGWKTSDRTPAHDYIAPAVLQLLPSGRSLQILDAGCGNGYLAGKLSAQGHNIIGVDTAEDGIEIARKAYPNLQFELFSVYDDFQSIVSNVDVVISSEVIEHLYFPRKFLENMYQVIRPGGCLILTTPYHGYMKNLLLSVFDLWDKHHTVDQEGGHIKFFSEKSISNMLTETGFDNIIFNNSGRIPWLWKSMVCRAMRNA
jgi:2-polyprenyl-3-methyl-5-hydroxy-6-metoxy-1,4-benzoquinol methylase